MQFIDLKQQYQDYKEEIQAELSEVMEKAQFIRGPILADFEEKLAAHTGAKHAIGCSSGTDAIVLGLLALGLQPGDEVIVPDFTFIATAEVVSFLGAVPVFADVDDETLNIDPDAIEKSITPKTKGIIAVSLYGQCADFDEISQLASKHDLWVIEDGAQSYGATYKGKRSGTLTEIGTTSFFPAKPLGCYGDGGAVFTNNDEYAEHMRLILNHGQDRKYHHKIIGMNARLDTLQAAILKVKLRHFDDEVERKQRVADTYSDRLQDIVETPRIRQHNTSVWAQYTVRTENRDAVTAKLKETGIPTAVHYPLPLHEQEAFESLQNQSQEFPISNMASKRVFSLPMHPYMTDDDIRFVCDGIEKAVRASS